MTCPVVLCCQRNRTERALIYLGRNQVGGLQAATVVACRIQDAVCSLLSLRRHGAVSPSPSICEPVVDLSMTQTCFCLQGGLVTVGGIWMSLVGFNPCCQDFCSTLREPDVMLAAVAGVTIGIHSVSTMRFQQQPPCSPTSGQSGSESSPSGWNQEVP